MCHDSCTASLVKSVITLKGSSLRTTFSAGLRSGISPLEAPAPALTVKMDASLPGWGGVLGSLLVLELWLKDNARFHINVLELRAVSLQAKGAQPFSHNLFDLAF